MGNMVAHVDCYDFLSEDVLFIIKLPLLGSFSPTVRDVEQRWKGSETKAVDEDWERLSN